MTQPSPCKLSSNSTSLGQGSHLPPVKLQLVEEFVGENMAESITLKQMAGVAHYSSSRFWHLFRNAVGCSPHQYVIHRRLKRAIELLSNTDDPLVNIAVDCGFSDQSHLIRLFKRHMGMTPKRMREMQKIQNQIPNMLEPS